MHLGAVVQRDEEAAGGPGDDWRYGPLRPHQSPRHLHLREPQDCRRQEPMVGASAGRWCVFSHLQLRGTLILTQPVTYDHRLQEQPRVGQPPCEPSSCHRLVLPSVSSLSLYYLGLTAISMPGINIIWYQFFLTEIFCFCYTILYFRIICFEILSCKSRDIKEMLGISALNPSKNQFSLLK